jgi:hypothetical protein
MELESVKIALDRKKHNKRIMVLLLITGFYSLVFAMFIIINSIEQAKFEWQKVAIAAFLFSMLLLSSLLLRFYIRLKKTKQFMIQFENGVLNDYSKPFNRAANLKVEDIKSITHWSETKGINQFKIVTKQETPKLKGLFNQLYGKHFYISDHLVDTEELRSLVELIDLNCSKH